MSARVLPFALALTLAAPSLAHADDGVRVRLRSPIPAVLEASDGDGVWTAACKEGEETRLAPEMALRVRLADGSIVSTPPVGTRATDVVVSPPAPPAARAAAIGLTTAGGAAITISLIGIFYVGFKNAIGAIGQDSCSFDRTPSEAASCEAARARDDRVTTNTVRSLLVTGGIGTALTAAGVTLLAVHGTSSRPKVVVKAESGGGSLAVTF